MSAGRRRSQWLGDNGAVTSEGNEGSDGDEGSDGGDQWLVKRVQVVGDEGSDGGDQCFSQLTQQNLNIERDAYITGAGIQVTPDSNASGDGYKVGRATYVKLLHLWDQNSSELASFDTSFNFFIASIADKSLSDGLTFFLAENNSVLTAAASELDNYYFEQSTIKSCSFNSSDLKVDEEKLPPPHDGSEDTMEIQNPVKRKNRGGQIAGLIAGIFVTVIASIAIFAFLFCRRRKNKGEETEEAACDEDMNKDFEMGRGLKDSRTMI
ncbi:hypothetical protein L1987_55191 [Smallanthus sonchifolius]|uniref:Uncharacterized protein n=1 Tax=Smallanthus sonchifolius TaxID=185202 RepID=A0ACB9E8W0_9ASTR|nr:hypothetical protein L1987_55191 [Smallanthus sonchifolius]